uniref:Uncharacterized protein n=1 Tax=Triticum urartu TaxID=4572 RepID=A0A8R7TGS0_TRIUA
MGQVWEEGRRLRGKPTGVGATENEDGVGRRGRLAGRNSRSKEAVSPWREAHWPEQQEQLHPLVGPTHRLLCCGPHGREGQLRRSWRRVQRPPPPLLFESTGAYALFPSVGLFILLRRWCAHLLQ